MILTEALGDWAWILAAMLAGGLIAGLLAGMLGLGGGGILVPVLYETFRFIGVDPSISTHLAIGTSLAIIVPTSLRSFKGHHARGSVDMDVLKEMAPMVLAGVVVGSVIAKFASGELLRLIWVTAAIFLATKMALGRDDWRLGDELPGKVPIWIFAFLLGTLSTLMGIGGALFMVTFMTLFNRPILEAISTSSGLGPLIAIPGVLGFMWAGWSAEGLPGASLGYVSLLAAAIMIPVSVFAAPYGVRFAHGINKRTLELVFATFLSIVAVRFITTLIG